MYIKEFLRTSIPTAAGSRNQRETARSSITVIQTNPIGRILCWKSREAGTGKPGQPRAGKAEASRQPSTTEAYLPTAL